ncbi:carboxypeptidase regulatory-like domain-containing protein [Streptomyces samsunensis]|uniref:carboxypeptidase-like regulatory domain-containing protein n=1 Tax=Streptomyces malaysiensis TaxID=92644 RepID=UPI000BFDAF45|nr:MULTISPECIES: carboxypeptidase-like regulatory domain-containing protein [Streptomyces]ATL87684.1 carbohydrate binding family 6 [Streptomyces malaysiensis]MCQ6245906.1 carboxypeptidase-like regulatory domain-containing protein [Streptomyces malaysiensis]NUH38047.1 carboxypeptidase regulatory-like domain-containing protein [Streptomyces samsunensis]QDL68940.1 carboxypeptidase regulatory-like domain-containing protein [Streptomyces malaysiensis]
MSRFIPLERSTLYSPAWLIPYDDFARRVRAAGVSVQLDRYDDGEWLPLDDMAVRTPGAAFAYPGLGRCAEPWAARPRRHRARFAADGYQPLYPADGRPFSAALVGVEFLVHPYDDAHPPTVVTEPRLVRLLPSVSFRYPPGLRTVHGAVVDAATGAPIANALVEAGGHTSRDLTPWHERTLSDPAGAFRLALRWEGEKADEHAVEETFHLQATERPGRSGSLVVRLPQDTERRHVIEIRES